ncbi:MAG: translation initiation factor IF-2 [Saprospiraceae bacterium]
MPPTKEEPEVHKRERPTLRVVGKIDLEAPKKPVAKEEPVQPKPAEQPVATPNEAPPQPNEVVAEKEKPAETPPPAPPPQESKTPEPILPPSEAPSEEPAAAEPDFYRADAPQLRGLKILGKVNLEQRPTQTPADRNKGRDNKGRGGRDNKSGSTAPGTPRPGSTSGDPQAQPATGAAGDAERRKRKRKKIQQPITAAAIQASLSTSAGDKKGRGRTDSKEVSQKEIEDQIRKTMTRMGAGASRKRQKIRRDKRDTMRERAEMAELADSEKLLQVTEFVSVSDLASLMNVKPADIIKACMSLGIFVSINQRLDAEIIEVVASEFGHEVEFISAEEQVEVEEEEVDDPNDLRPRQPIVTVMGHVDHGKTSLLDYIRKAKVAEGEAGGITQHIGAYEVMVGAENDEKRITFLDTPGHEAFTAMRARGAKVTDIAIIVIAADDSIMPQTREAISHAQAAGVPLVFAINKIDKDGADPERIKNELAQMNLLVEEWGGKYQSQDISAKKGTNVDKLLEKVLLEAELLELKANPSRRATGTVLEASLDKGRGYVTKILVENGTLNEGDPIIAGEHSGKVKAMFNERGKKIKLAGPATPVLVLGLGGAPQAGEKIKETATEGEAREIASRRAQIIREQANRASKRISLEEIGRRLALGNFKELNLIVKGDVDGSIEALSDSLIKLSMEKIQVNVIHKAVGQIVDSDVMLASASDAIIIGFQVRPSLTARKLAEREGVEIKLYSIIYEAIEEVKAAMEGMLEPTKEEEITGQAEVRDVFKISKVGTVAGCLVQEGKITRNQYVRIIRDGIVIYPVHEGQHAELTSLKRFKEDQKEVRAGLECGMTVRNFNDIKVGDVIESYVIKEVKATL